MKYVTRVLILFCAAVFCVLFTPGAQANEENQKTIVTFNQPVEIPGRVLPAGNYVFELMDSPSDRDIVQVWNGDQTNLLGTYLTIPDERMQPSDEPVVKFEERAANAPEAIKEWFYPDRLTGHEFIYPHVRAVELAQQTNQPVPTMPSQPAANTTKPAQTPAVATNNAAKGVPPSAKATQMAQATPPPVPQTTQTAKATLPTLPKTASPLPLIGLLGLTSLGAASAVRLILKCMA